ncbi:MAG: Photosynthesis system assembly factor [Bacteroidota bacterium]|nr:Photosynthesis system assembly factor [Bacteroidota bacterium]
MIIIISLSIISGYAALAGEAWREIQTGRTEDLTFVWFINENTGWRCGTVDTFFKTADGGLNWRRMNADSGYINIFWGMYIVD